MVLPVVRYALSAGPFWVLLLWTKPVWDVPQLSLLPVIAFDPVAAEARLRPPTLTAAAAAVPAPTAPQRSNRLRLVVAKRVVSCSWMATVRSLSLDRLRRRRWRQSPHRLRVLEVCSKVPLATREAAPP